MEKAIQRCSFVVLVVFVCFAFISQGYGAIDWWGDVQPPDPSTWTSDTDVDIGNCDDGGISVTEGDDIEAYRAYLGYNAGASGIATIDGAGSSWSCSENLSIGFYGQGTLEISNGGNVEYRCGYIGREHGSTGEVSVDGAGSNLSCSGYYNTGLIVGYYGQGILEISNGGNVTCENDNHGVYAYIGYDDGSMGIVSVDGAGSSWYCSEYLFVGYGGQGTLEITSGGNVSCKWDGYIGGSWNQSGGTGTVSVDGAGSNWSCGDELYVGYKGQGMLEISNGGNVSCNGGYIGYKSGWTGEVSVGGAGSSWYCTGGELFVGYEGQGTLNISNGGNVRCDYSGWIGYHPGTTGEVSVDGAGSSLRCGTDLYVGKEGQGTLEISSGGYVRCWYGYIGNESGSTGEVSVDGEGSSLRCGVDLYVGKEGQGTLEVSNGGYVSCVADLYVGYYGQGTLEISSGGYVSCVADLYVGYYGQGTLEISGGGNVKVIGDTWVATKEGSTGQINFNNGTLTTGGLLATPADLLGTGVINTHGIVSDIDLLFDSTHGTNQTIILGSLPGQNITINLSQDSTGSLGAGYASEGTLTIKDGVSVQSYRGILGHNSGSAGQATVDGAGSSWSCSSDLYVGYYGQGTLEISNGGNVTCENDYYDVHGYIGYDYGSIGDVSVDGAGSSCNCGDKLYVGYAGQGTLEICNGGNVSCYAGYIGHWSGSTGEVSVDGAGSSLSYSDDLYVGKYGEGTLNISNGGNVEVGGTLRINSTGTLNIDSASSVNVGGAILFKQDSTLIAQEGAEVHMTGANFRNESRNSANLAGLSNLTLIFEGGSEVVDDLEVAGKDEGAVLSAFSVDNFLIGTLQLGGEAAGRIKLIDNFDNQPGWSGSEALYVSNLILNAGATIDLNDLHLYYLNGGFPKQFFNGDSNLDGLVDDSDLNIVLSDWGETVPPGNPRADLSGDLLVDDADLNILLSDWGKGTSPGYGQSIPEPATLMLLLFGVGIVSRKNRK